MTIAHSRVKRTVALAIAVVVAGSLAACSGTSSSTPDTSKLTIAFDSDVAPFGFDPLRYSNGQAIFYAGLYEGLATMLPDGSTGPDLATEFVYNEDSTVLTLTLAEGVEFSDGSTLSADLVKANLDRRNDPDLPAYNSFATGGTTEITSVDVVDDTHVALTFAISQPGFETNLASVGGMIIGQTAIDDIDVLAESAAGSGAYELDEATVKGSSYVLTKKEESRDAAEYAYDTIDFKIFTDAQARVNAVISGQADTGFILTSTAALAEDKGLGISQIGGTVSTLLMFDKSGVTSEPFADPNVRLALSYAIDRTEFVDGLHPGEIPTNNALPEDNPGFSEELNTEYAYDPEKAKQLLADAGYPDGFEFDNVISADVQTDNEAFQKYFAAIGVTMNLKLATSTEEVFGAVNTQPMGYLPLNWGNPAGAMFGVILGFANPHNDADPALQGATGAVLGAQTDEDRAAALVGLNTALVSTATVIPVFEQLTTWTYTDAVEPVVFPGQNNVPLLSSFAPAK